MCIYSLANHHYHLTYAILLLRDAYDLMQLSNIEVQQELNTIQALGGYQQRLKRSLNGKVRLIKTENTHPLANRVGAQVSFYLPLHLADDVKR